MIFVLRQIQKKCREQNMGLSATFVDLTKAFDTVSRDGLWKIVGAMAFPPNFSPSSASPRSTRSGEAQWVSVGQLPHLRRRQAGIRSGPNVVLHLLRHHAP